jgi:RimJ/RimL family protein N-acetyltransferase
MYILCDGSLEVGSLRLEYDAQGAEISYSIAPEYRGHGYGKELISLAGKESGENTWKTLAV